MICGLHNQNKVCCRKFSAALSLLALLRQMRRVRLDNRRVFMTLLFGREQSDNMRANNSVYAIYVNTK